MGSHDNKRTTKMRRRKSQAKKKLRELNKRAKGTAVASKKK